MLIRIARGINLHVLKSSSSLIKFLHKYTFRMDRAYFRQIEGSDRFDLNFRFADAAAGVDRQFNFCRQLDETVGTFLQRVNANVEKAFIKKNKKKKKNNNAEQVDTDVKASIILNNEPVSDDTICKTVFKQEHDITLQILQKQFTVLVNAPWIDDITLPSCILATCCVYPLKFDTLNTDIKMSDFKWFKSTDKSNGTWSEVGEGYLYIPSNQDIGYYLKLVCTPKNGELLEGPSVEAIADVEVSASPGLCPFETRQNFTQTKLPRGNEFRVVSYNILADLYCDSDHTRNVLYPYCPPYALALDYRKQLIVKEVSGYNADIVCMQEVDKKVYEHDFLPLFDNMNYEVSFAQKAGQVAEGLMCMHNRDKFRLLHADVLVLAEQLETNPMFAELYAKIGENEQLKERVLARKNVLQIVTLESAVDTKNVLVVANVHVYFHPDADHIRLVQGGISIRLVQRAYDIVKRDHPDKKVTLIYCGDFNSVPECGIYQLFTTGRVTEDCIDFQSHKDEIVKNISFTQPFKLGSGCGTPQYTNFTAGFHGCLDYIYYDTENLAVTQVVPMPSHEEVIANTALPSVVFPSDHIALICDFKWTL